MELPTLDKVRNWLKRLHPLDLNSSTWTPTTEWLAVQCCWGVKKHRGPGRKHDRAAALMPVSWGGKEMCVGGPDNHDQTTMLLCLKKKKKVCFGKVFLFLDRIIEKPACVAGENELDLVH